MYVKYIFYFTSTANINFSLPTLIRKKKRKSINRDIDD